VRSVNREPFASISFAERGAPTPCRTPPAGSRTGLDGRVAEHVLEDCWPTNMAAISEPKHDDPGAAATQKCAERDVEVVQGELRATLANIEADPGRDCDGGEASASVPLSEPERS